MTISTQEFYITSGAGAADNNGGTPLGINDGPILTLSDVTCAGGTHLCTLTDNLGGSWPGCTPLTTYLCFDTTGVKAWGQIISIAGSVATVRLPGYPSGLASANKAVNVGGAWDKPSSAAAMIGTISPGSSNNLTFSVPTRLRINVKAGTYAESGFTWGINSNAANHFHISPYLVVPGDIDWRTDISNRITLDLGAGSSGISFSSTSGYASLIDGIQLISTYNAAAIYLLNSSNASNIFRNCVSTYAGTQNTSRCFSGVGKYVRCLADRTNVSNSIGFYRPSYCIGCVARGAGKVSLNGSGFELNGGGLNHCLSFNNTTGVTIDSSTTVIYLNTIANNIEGIKYISNSNRIPNLMMGNKLVNNTTSIQLLSSGTSIPGTFLNEFDDNSTLILGELDESEQFIDAGLAVVDYSTYDFRPDPSSPGNAVGFPGVMAIGGAEFTGYGDLGCFPLETTGGGGPAGFPLSRILN